MSIRRAKQEDAERIHKLAKSLWIDWSNPQRKGFLVNKRTEQHYAARTESPFFYVAEDNSRLAGFLMCFDSSTFRKFAAQGIINPSEGDVKFMLNQKDSWVFGDQIGIDPKLSRNKIGSAMMKQLFSDMDERAIKDMYVSILHKPVRNYASIDFCTGLGFKHLKGADAENQGGTTWGMYHLKLK